VSSWTQDLDGGSRFRSQELNVSQLQALRTALGDAEFAKIVRQHAGEDEFRRVEELLTQASE